MCFLCFVFILFFLALFLFLKSLVSVFLSFLHFLCFDVGFSCFPKFGGFENGPVRFTIQRMNSDKKKLKCVFNHLYTNQSEKIQYIPEGSYCAFAMNRRSVVKLTRVSYDKSDNKAISGSESGNEMNNNNSNSNTNNNTSNSSHNTGSIINRRTSLFRKASIGSSKSGGTGGNRSGSSGSEDDNKDGVSDNIDFNSDIDDELMETNNKTKSWTRRKSYISM